MRHHSKRIPYIVLQRKRAKRRRKVLIGSLILAVAMGIFTFLRPSSDEIPQQLSSAASFASQEAVAQKPQLTAQPIWSEHAAAAAIGAEEYGVIATTGAEEKRPTASIAKVITALAVLEKHPLNNGEQGPEIPITERDEEIYRNYVAQNGSVTPVKAGVPISLYNSLEAMLLPSSNNMSDTTVLWAFGSMEEYHKYANDMLKRLGLNDTVVGGDASGLSPETQSTPTDLIKLGEHALKNPVIAEIVAKQEIELPLAGVIPNYNRLVKNNGFSGLKLGDSNEAGGTMLFSAKHVIDGKEVELIGVVLGTEYGYSQQDIALQIMESTKQTLRH